MSKIVLKYPSGDASISDKFGAFTIWKIAVTIGNNAESSISKQQLEKNRFFASNNVKIEAENIRNIKG